MSTTQRYSVYCHRGRKETRKYSHDFFKLIKSLKLKLTKTSWGHILICKPKYSSLFRHLDQISPRWIIRRDEWTDTCWADLLQSDPDVAFNHNQHISTLLFHRSPKLPWTASLTRLPSLPFLQGASTSPRTPARRHSDWGQTCLMKYASSEIIPPDKRRDDDQFPFTDIFIDALFSFQTPKSLLHHRILLKTSVSLWIFIKQLHTVISFFFFFYPCICSVSNQPCCEVSCRLDGSWTQTGFIAEELCSCSFQRTRKKRTYASYWGPFQISSSLLVTMWIYLCEFVVYVSVHLWEDTSHFTSRSYTLKVQNNRGRPIIRADIQHFSDCQYPWFCKDRQSNQ